MTVCNACLVERERLVYREAGVTLHAVDGGWVRARFNSATGLWMPLSNNAPSAGVAASPSLHDLVRGGLRVHLTAEEACGVESAPCERCRVRLTPEWMDLLCELRADAKAIELMRTRGTRPPEEAVAEVRGRRLFPALLAVEAKGLVDVQAVRASDLTDEVVWEAWQMGLRAPGGRSRYESMPVL